MAPLKAAISALDPAPDKTKDLTLLLSLLSELCEQKNLAFTESIEAELRTAGTIENKTIPVTEILAKHKEYRAYVKSDAGKIASETSSAIKKFISGGSENIVDGIAALVTTGIEAIIGAGSGTQQELSSYYIVVQKFGILRFDIRVWSRQIEASGITKSIETALAIVAYKSSVDVKKLSLNTFLIAYQDQLSKIGISEEKWEGYLDTAVKLYKELSGQSVQGNMATSEKQVSTTYKTPGQLYTTLWDGNFDEGQHRLTEGRRQRRLTEGRRQRRIEE